MASVPHVGALSRDPSVPLPSPLRAVAYALLLVSLSVSAYICTQMILLVYHFYLVLQWLGKLAE